MLEEKIGRLKEKKKERSLKREKEGEREMGSFVLNVEYAEDSQ